MIRVDDLRVEYSSRKSRRRALDGVSLRVDPGQVVGLLGPNGAGKTTLTKVLSTLLHPTAGSARVCDFDVVRDRRSVQRSIGVSFGGDLGIYSRLSATDNLRFFAAMYGLARRGLRERIHDALATVALADRAKDRVETFSRGMKQRLHIARAILHEPPVLLLDEPSSGLDPVSAIELRKLVLGLRDAGRAVLLTTHDLVEAEAVCDHVNILSRGSIVLAGSPAQLRSNAATDAGSRLELGVPPAALGAAVAPFGLLGAPEAAGAGAAVRVRDVAGAVRAVAQSFPDALPTLRVGHPTLEEIYVSKVDRS